ncbi:hypothetical protein KM043_014342 [Ampulex compressa]|nr:hypothetical protein KM043_014342 [Ampulex compressa]
MVVTSQFAKKSDPRTSGWTTSIMKIWDNFRCWPGVFSEASKAQQWDTLIRAHNVRMLPAATERIHTLHASCQQQHQQVNTENENI